MKKTLKTEQDNSNNKCLWCPGDESLSHRQRQKDIIIRTIRSNL